MTSTTRTEAVKPLVVQTGGRLAPAPDESESMVNLREDEALAATAPSRLRLRLRMGIVVMGVTAVTGAIALRLIHGAPVPDTPSATIFARSLAVLVLASLASGATAYLLGRSWGRRLERVAEVLENTQSGRYETRTRPASNDEIGVLERRANLLSSSAQVREKRITESALTDALTGLPNRALLTDRMRHAISANERERKKFSVAVIDLDRFKWVNDTLGHAAGDLLLIEVARRLKATVRTADTVARLGGDEFVLLLGGGIDEAQVVCEHVLEAMKKPLRLQGQMVDIGLSIGIAVYPDHGRDSLALMRHADSAMYTAKRKQTGRLVYTGDSTPVKPNSLSMLGEMRNGLVRNEFLLEYQPKLDLHTGLISGLEGLVRWAHPTRGRVNPAEFIPLAEQTGFMRELTTWVVSDGVRFAAQLARENLDVCVSVNVSAHDIENPEFARTIRLALEREQLDPARLCLEITESGVLSETETALRNLGEIDKMGVRLAVDDFGTGYASLKQLQNLPVHELKIDRSFVSGMHENPGNATIVDSTIEMGRKLGMRVVAEGVETVNELRALAKMGCDEVQGFYLSRPLPQNDVVSWIRMRHVLHENSREAYFRMLIQSDKR